MSPLSQRTLYLLTGSSPRERIHDLAPLLRPHGPHVRHLHGPLRGGPQDPGPEFSLRYHATGNP